MNIRIEDHTKEVMERITERINLALDLAGEVIEGHAKDECPVDTGLLRNSITHAVGGESVTHSYHASYGSNRSSSGKRYSAGSKNAGSVGFGSFSGTIGQAEDHICVVGSNVEYAPVVEFKDMKHITGKAHFLRDGAMNHIDEIRDVCQKTLRSI